MNAASKKVSVTFVGDPMDGKDKVTGYRVFKRWSDEAEEEVVVRKPIIKKHKAEDPPEITLFGMTFQIDQPVEIDTASEFWSNFGEKLKGNPHFEVKEAKAKAAPAKADG